MKPFNLQDALAGKPVVLRDGTDLPTDRLVHVPNHQNANERLLVIAKPFGYYPYSEDGRRSGQAPTPGGSPADLFMKSIFKSGWINMYRNLNGTMYSSDHPYPTKEAAEAEPLLSTSNQIKARIDTLFIVYEV